MVAAINPDLTTALDLTVAQQLQENRNIAFMGTTKIGSFDLTEQVAARLLNSPLNPNGRPNSDVIRPWVNGIDITGRPRKMWIIDFGASMSEEDAALYELPYEYLKHNVKPEREKNNRQSYRKLWWLHGEPRPALRDALLNLSRYIVTPRVSKYRLFAWQNPEVIPDSAVIAIARDDDYFFGVLHSCPHELWARGTGTQLREVESGFRYTPTTTFETFPFPWPPGQEPEADPRVEAIAAAARRLVQLRDAWLNPPGATAADLKPRTLTNLYNARPDWLAQAHTRLDIAVLAAYNWPTDLPDAVILERLLALNQTRAGGHPHLPTRPPAEAN